MSNSVSPRKRASRLSWLGPVLLLTSGLGVFAVLAVTFLATQNLLVSLAQRPRVTDDWRQPVRIAEARRPAPVRHEVVAEAEAVVVLAELPSETYARAAARADDKAFAGLRARLAQAPLMYDAGSSTWRGAGPQSGIRVDGSLLTASVGAPKISLEKPRFDVAFEKAKPVIAVTERPVLASLTPPSVDVAKAEEAAPPAPVAVEVAQVPLPPIAPLPPVAVPVVAAVETAPIPMPTPRPADFAKMAQVRPIVPVKLDDQTASIPTPRPAALAYATPDLEPKRSGPADFFNSLLDRGVAAAMPSRGSGVAVYDISSATVRLPSGERLEAHSGLAHRQDNPAYVREKNRGPTPPNFYDLRMREALFHGAAAIRLTPRDKAKVFNRDGLLAHPYMYVGGGGRQQSNGCVVFKDYPRFLRAFRSGEVRHLVVVPNMAALSTYMAKL